MAKEVKEETKTKRIINLVVMILEIIVIIIGISVSIATVMGSTINAGELRSGYNITTVLTDSMDGNITNEYKVGSFRAKKDLLIVKSIDDEEKNNLEVGDVITYFGNVGGYVRLISHRIIKIEDLNIGESTLKVFYTLGDNQRTDSYEENIKLAKKIYPGDIEGLVVKKVSNVGIVIYWLQESNNFLWAVVIPLAALLAYNAYLLIRMIVEYKIKRAKEEGELAVEALKAQSTIDEEEIKRKAIEEYLAQQKAQEEPKEGKVEDNNIVQDEKPKG